MSYRRRSIVPFFALALISLVGVTSRTTAQSLTVLGYNVESGGAKADVVAKRVAEVQKEDLWGFCEVQNDAWANQFAEAAKDLGSDQEFKAILGTTGAPDLLAIVYNAKRLVFVSKSELHELNQPSSWRSPLAAKFKLRENGLEFIFMVNHLARGNSAQRHKQAKGLNAWVQTQSVPVIAVGDYNFDFNTRKEGDAFKGDQGDRDEGLDLMLSGGHFKWVRPTPIVPTNASSHRSLLDFVFVSGKAREWRSTSAIIVKDGDFPDDGTTSDHRPVKAEFDLSGEPTPVAVRRSAVREAIQIRINELEEKLSELKEELRRLDR